MVWFSQCIPRYAFLVWLFMRERLKTQVKLKMWKMVGIDNVDHIRRPLCNTTKTHILTCFFSVIFHRKFGQR